MEERQDEGVVRGCRTAERMETRLLEKGWALISLRTHGLPSPSELALCPRGGPIGEPMGSAWGCRQPVGNVQSGQQRDGCCRELFWGCGVREPQEGRRQAGQGGSSCWWSS